jgi:Arylsulfotransferase (ASST)
MTACLTTRRVWARVAAVLAMSAFWLASAATPSTAGGLFVPRCPLVQYHSAPTLHAQRVCMNVGVTTHGSQPGTYLFMTPGGDMGTGVGIFKDDGQLVWWQPGVAPRLWNLTVVRYQGQPFLAEWAGRPVDNGHHESGAIYLYNEHYQRVGTITMGGSFRANGVDIHEFTITPQGDALLAASPRVETTVSGRPKNVYDYIVQKVSLVRGSTGIHTGRVLFQWDALKHIPVSQSRLPPPPDKAFDYFHGNAIAQDTDGNLVISARNTWGIYKINVKTGGIMWQLGAKGDPKLSEPWCYQHDIRPLGNNRYSLFDDGGAGPNCLPGATAHPARGLIIQVDPAQHPTGVRLVRAYTHTPPLFPGICGSFQLLANGDALIGWGSMTEATEYAPNGSTLMDLSLSNWSYRDYRFPWVGQPLTPPAVAARRAGAATRVWVSWNGSTEVAAWRMLAGPTASHVIPVTGPKGKTGFETEISLPQPYKWVAVQALSASGTVLATSTPVAPS